MFFSIRHKLAVLISVLLLLSIGASGYVLIAQKRAEIKEDIWQNALNFAELSTKPLVDSYNLYFSSESFLFFQRDLQHIFSLNKDVESIRIAKFSGELIFDSSAEQKSGDRVESELIPLLEDIKPAIQTDIRTLYMKQDSSGKNIFVDNQEQPIPPITKEEKVQYIVYPSDDHQSRIIYKISYKFLDQRISSAVHTIMLILVAIAFVGIGASVLFARQLLIPLHKLTKAAKNIAEGDLSTQVHIRRKDETGILANTFNTMVQDLKKNTELQLQHERVSKELEIAKKIQADSLPKEAPHILGLDIAVSTSSASEVGGDCYDFLTLPDRSHFFYLGDATGHGVPASLVVALTNAAMYAQTQNTSDPKRVIDASNNIIASKTSHEMFLTLVGCHWNPQTKTLQYIQAGHEPLLLFRKREKKITQLPGGGIALGMTKDSTKATQVQNINFEPGDIVFVYSDGIPEANISSREKLGMKRFAQILVKYVTLPTAEQIQNAVLQDVYKFMGAQEQADDITLMTIRNVSDEKK